MQRFLRVLAPVAIVAGAVLFFKNYKIEGLEHLRVVPRAGGGLVATSTKDAPPPVARDGSTIRVASFNIQVFGESKLAKPAVADVLAQVVRRFDVVAIQEIRAANQDLLPRFVAAVNAAGAHYDFAIGPRLGRTDSKEQYAFIYNRASVELDPQSVYTVEDPDDRLHREPLVAGFRVRGPPPERAFTFTAINIHTDPDEVASEVDALADVVRAVRNDGRMEDDIILLGDLNADDHHLGQLGRMPYIRAVITGKPTNTRGTKLYDNIVFDDRATTEFAAQSGVFDLLGEFRLSLAQALDVSDHLPIWAEFKIEEDGAQPGRLAHFPSAPRRR